MGEAKGAVEDSSVHAYAGTPDVIKMPCNPMDQGSSGGPWFYEKNGKNTIIGVASHRFWGGEGAYSPYLGNSFHDICVKAGGCESVGVLMNPAFTGETIDAGAIDSGPQSADSPAD